MRERNLQAEMVIKLNRPDIARLSNIQLDLQLLERRRRIQHEDNSGTGTGPGTWGVARVATSPVSRFEARLETGPETWGVTRVAVRPKSKFEPGQEAGLVTGAETRMEIRPETRSPVHSPPVVAVNSCKARARVKSLSR